MSRFKILAFMVRVLLMALITGIFVASPLVATAHAPHTVVHTTTNVEMIYDNDNNGLGGPYDMTGPVVGMVNYKQDNDGNLVLTIRIADGRPNTTYHIYLTVGPSHVGAEGFVDVGTIATDANGIAKSKTVTVGDFPLVFPPGYRTDHIDLMKALKDHSAGVLVAGALNYYKPTPPPAAAPEEKAAGSVGQGDPGL